MGQGRIPAIDTFRGIVIAGMVIANHLSPLPSTPVWLRHAPTFKGITILDIGFPFLLFILGLLMPLSYERRLVQSGPGRTLLHFLKRNSLFIAFGLAGNAVLGQNPLHWWSVLSAIGLAGLLGLPFVRLRPGLRLATGILLWIAFELIRRLGYQEWLLANDRGELGGPPAAIAWAGLILVASFLSRDLERPDRTSRASAILGLALVGIGLGLSPFVPVTKPLVTISYLAITTGLAAIGLALVLLLDRFIRFRLTHFIILGSNPLLVYMLSGLLSETGHRLLSLASLWAALLSAAGVYALCFLVARFLYRRSILLRV
ncbi:MAG: heparan-alpha-glucosaminide N-acetyltransferase domain-containing protein [candidate division WOR-3 bacterium]